MKLDSLGVGRRGVTIGMGNKANKRSFIMSSSWKKIPNAKKIKFFETAE